MPRLEDEPCWPKPTRPAKFSSELIMPLRRRRSAYQLFIFVVPSNPEPDKILVVPDSYGAMLTPDAHRPIAADWFQMEGRMVWVVQQQDKIPVRQLPHMIGK